MIFFIKIKFKFEMIVLAKRKNLIQILLFMISVIILIAFCYFSLPYSLRRVFIKVKPLKLPDFKDNIKDLNDKELFQLIDSDSNLALSYWQKWKDYRISNDWPGINFDTCYSIIPWVEELKFNNIYWQVLSNVPGKSIFSSMPTSMTDKMKN